MTCLRCFSSFFVSFRFFFVFFVFFRVFLRFFFLFVSSCCFDFSLLLFCFSFFFAFSCFFSFFSFCFSSFSFRFIFAKPVKVAYWIWACKSLWFMDVMHRYVCLASPETHTSVLHTHDHINLRVFCSNHSDKFAHHICLRAD